MDIFSQKLSFQIPIILLASDTYFYPSTLPQSKMSFLLDIPETLPLLTAPDHVLFPQAMMPIFVVNATSLKMLQECLIQDRLLVFACSNEEIQCHSNYSPNYTLRTPFTRVATVALIRACYRPTSQEALVILQGLGRIYVKEVSQTNAYPIATIESLKTSLDATPHQLRLLKNKLHLLLKQKAHPGKKILSILESINNPQVFLDLVAFSVCTDTLLKMQLLATLSDKKRFELLIEYLTSSKFKCFNSLEKNSSYES